MISKMTKYSFILLSGDQERFLSGLRDLGVVDIARSAKPVDGTSQKLFDDAALVRKAINQMGKVDHSSDAAAQTIEGEAKNVELPAVPLEKAKLILSTVEDLEKLSQDRSQTIKETENLKIWGDFDRDRVEELQSAGYQLHFHTVSRKGFNPEWSEQYPLQIVNENNDKLWFVVVGKTGEEYSFPIDESAAPEYDWRVSEAKITSIDSQIVGKKAVLLRSKETTSELEAEYQRILHEADLYLAGLTGELSSENMVTAFVGFAPADDDARLSEAFDGMDVYWWKEDAVEEDNPPIKLRNNKFISMFEVLTGMYGMPVYSEFDPTPILGPFFLLFFSMCLGDAGYGLLLVLIGWYLKKKMPSMASMAPLVMTLGVGTIVVGTVLGSLFGVSLAEASWVPDWLKSCMITGEIAGFSANMVLAVAIGVFHICLAMVVKAICYTVRFGLKATISNWAWNLLIIGGIIVGGMALAGVMDENVTKIVVIVLGAVSALGIYVFNTPGRNPLINIGSGLWDTYNMVTGLMGDVLSYIRLYALGLAGGMLGMAFNNIATMVLDGVPVPGLNWLFFVIILLFGHALNLAMSCLGAFVHPLRLTFVEYFKNSGYEGTGKKYKPLTNECEE